MSEESILINPEEFKSKRQSRKSKENSSKEKEKYLAKGNLVEIEFESEGRFSMPEIMYFEDYSVEDVQEFAVCGFDDLIETTVVVLDRLKNKDCEVSIAKATPNEFIEILVGMKIKFDKPEYKHVWMCDCQLLKPEDEQQASEQIIPLRDLKFKSIREVDEKFRAQVKDIFDKMNNNEFLEYLKGRYGETDKDLNTWSKEQELETIQLKEPIKYRNKVDNKLYSFNLMRMENVIEAQRMVNRKYSPLLKSIQNKKNNGKPINVFKSEQQDELKKIERNKAKDIISYSEGLTLHAVDGELIKTNEEKIAVYKKLKRDDYFEFEAFLKNIDYGIYYDGTLSCSCGKTEGRILQREINPFGLLPIDPDSKDGSIRRDDRGLNIYFGI